MAGSTAIKKIVNYFWGDAEAEQEDEALENYGNEAEVLEEQESSNSGIDAINPFKRKSKIVSIPQPQQIKMKIAKPTNFDQVDEIINQLKDGHIEKVSNSIFVVAPLNYDIINENAKEKIESKFSASWIK